ncbi:MULTISPECIES: DUF4124 domain-containing protein [unclassified Variovorax]|uniref:DUF4124 domain-containing protein n=1 Tax=unclassified Variovorax TaxID=663243 RepID=UPI00076CB5B8|nr:MULTISPECIES: DUF4124 domain-containing protein [unclassified Variovorax]KWT74118.1 hypothetical protein APY03_5672 [Variovorax sp. WDL1]PNG52191.1 hypothetical protein CHC07_04562 [Variovorax sp. B4]PNG54731.1 hypothetical protein CHC06_03528 [Variovorax sp. B2]VTV15724.1 hypothetical protein WDL1CHR_06101 [Variovorax sp. WDL1]
MHRFLVLCLLSTLGTLCNSEVIRCADAAGNVSYTDGACPAGASRVGRVPLPAPSTTGQAERQTERNADAAPARPPPRAPTEAAAIPPQAPAGPVIIDPRAGAERSADPRRSDRGDDYSVIGDGYAYPGAYRQPRPRDMRPRLRNCDATGCQDTQGNHYNRSGQLDRYQSLDGKTCRPVGTTTICR